MKITLIFTILVFGLFILAACNTVNHPPQNITINTNITPSNGSNQQQNTQQTNQTNQTGNQNVKEFSITAKQFSFEPGVINVSQGDKVRLIVTSIDVTHGFVIAEYNINEKLNPNEPVTIEFTADKKGTFTFYCNVFCGSGHSEMKGTLIVN